MRLRVAARQSDLARLQAYRVGDILNKRLGHEVVYQFRQSLGDVNQSDPLWKMPEKGVFTEDFVEDLRRGQADLVVHSWKDLPTADRGDTQIVATLPRADSRDLFLFRRDRWEPVRATQQLRVLTSSPRRSYNLESFFRDHLPLSVQDVSFLPVRGNILTRLNKLMSLDVDGLVVAKAALDRLLAAQEDEFAASKVALRAILSQTQWMVLPLSVNPSAAAQGALAIEVLKSRSDLRSLLEAINCRATFHCVTHERSILANYGGGCHQKIGVSVLSRPFGEITYLKGQTDSGEVLSQVALQPDPSQPRLPRAETEDKIFPREAEEASFFVREELSDLHWKWVESKKYLWVARESAWPKNLAAQVGQIVWCAGLKTWRKLALRGIWVHGSSESLGEGEAAQVETLLDTDSIEWVKLTHLDSDGSSPSDASKGQGRHGSDFQMVKCATYRLKPLDGVADLRRRTHFFWTSGSAFDRALELFPEIRHRYHASGPGLTHLHLRRILGPTVTPAVFLGVEDWRAAISGFRKKEDQ